MSKAHKQDTRNMARKPEPTSLESASAKAQTAYSGAVAAIEGNPLAALLGGIALGAVAGALIPRSESEKALLAPLGERLADAARSAVAAGREAGLGALGEAGLDLDGLREQVSGLISHATAAAGTASGAAFAAAKDKALG